MNNTNSGPPLVMKITDGGAGIPPAEGITLVAGSPMNDAADWVADNGNTVAELNGFQHFLAAVDCVIPPCTWEEEIAGGTIIVDVDFHWKPIPAFSSFETENDDAGINTNKVIGNVSLVGTGVEYKAQCLDEEENIKVCSSARSGCGDYFKAGVSAIGRIDADRPAKEERKSCGVVCFCTRKTTLSATALQSELMSGAVLGGSRLLTTVRPQSTAFLPALVALETLDSVVKLEGPSQAQIPTSSSDLAGAGRTARMTRVLRGNIWKSLGRRLACRLLFVNWAKLSFLYRTPDCIPDQHSYYPPTSLIAVFDSSASQAYLERRWQLLGKLQWTLFCMQFRRLSLWAKMLMLIYSFRRFQQFYKCWCSRSRDGPSANKATVSFWPRDVLHCFLWFCAAILVYCLLGTHEQQSIGSTMLIYDDCPSFFSLAQFAAFLMYCLSFCMNIPHQGISQIMAGSECIIDNLCDSSTFPLPSFSSFSSTCQALMPIWFLLLFNRVVPPCIIFTTPSPAGQHDKQMHSKVSPMTVLGPSMTGIDTNVTDNSMEINNFNLCAYSGEQQEAAQPRSSVALVTIAAVVGEFGSTLGPASSSHIVKRETRVSDCPTSQPDGNFLVHHNVSGLNKLGKLHFAAVHLIVLLQMIKGLQQYCPHLIGKFVELDETNDVLQYMHVSSLHLQTIFKTMLKEALLLDCLFTKALVAADAHENPKERRIVMDQTSLLGCRSDTLIRRLEMALEAPLCNMLATATAVVPVPEASSVVVHISASNHVGAHHVAISNSGDWAKARDTLGDWDVISSSVDSDEVLSRTARTPHDPDDGPTIILALIHMHSHVCSFDEICLSQGRVQCIVYRPDGTPIMLGPQPKDLSGKALHSIAASALCMDEDCFYLTSHGRKQQSSQTNWPLHNVGLTVSFKTLVRYRGAGRKRSRNIEDPGRGQVRRNPMRSGRPCLGQFALVEYAHHIPVYRTSVPALEELVARANSSTQCQLHCAGIRAAAALYLEEAPEQGKGMGIRLITPVLDGQRLVLCYYSGVISANDNGGNHCLQLGSWFGNTVFLDGAQCVPSREQHNAPLQIVNHRCHEHSNSEVHWKEFEDDAGGLGLLELHVKGPLAVGTFLSFDYVRNGGNFFRPGLAGTKTPSGHQRIHCNCGPEGVCPNGLQRFERAVHQRLLALVPGQTAQYLGPSEANTVPTAPAQPMSDQGRDVVDIGLRPGSVASGEQFAQATPPSLASDMAMKETDSVVLSILESMPGREQLASTKQMDPKTEVLPLKDPWTRLDLQILNHELSTAGPGLIVNSLPYASLRGTLRLKWQGKWCVMELNDEVRAVRGEGSCGLLGIQDIIQGAESALEFQSRRRNHPDLQGTFQERWELLAAMANDGNAEGIRSVISCHALTNRHRLCHIFREDPAMTEGEISQMHEFERMHGFNLEASDHSYPVRKAAFSFLRPTMHLDERYLKLLLDWLEHKVALIPFTQVANGKDGEQRVYHVPEADLISERAVLFIKLLNIEKQGPTRTVLNHFNRVGGQHPVGFLEDLVAEQTPSMEFKASIKTASACSPKVLCPLVEIIETVPVTGYSVVPEGSPFTLDQNAEFARPIPRLCHLVESTDVLSLSCQTMKSARPLDAVNRRLSASVPSLSAQPLRINEVNKTSTTSAQSSSNSGQDFMDIGQGSGRAVSDAQIMYGSVCGKLENTPVEGEDKLARWCTLELTPEKERTIAAQSPEHTSVKSLVPATPVGQSLKTMFQAPSASCDRGTAAVQVDPTQVVNKGHCPVNTPQTTSLQLPVPASAAEAEILLNQHFDLASYWGPSLSLTRAERFKRGLRLRGVPPEWVNAVSEWVSVVLVRYPELARLKRDQRIHDTQHPSACVQGVTSDQERVQSTENKLTAETFQSDQVTPFLLESDQTLPPTESRPTSGAVPEFDKLSVIASDPVTDPKTVSNSAAVKMSLYPIFSPTHRDYLATSSIVNARGSLKSSLRKSKQVGKVKPQVKLVQTSLLGSWYQSQPSRSMDRSSSTQDEALPRDSNSTVPLDPCSPEVIGGSAPAPPAAPAPISTESSRLYRVSLIPDATVASSLTPWIPGTQGLYPRFGRGNAKFPLWNARVEGMRRQQALFALSDQICPNAFYVAADVWTPSNKGWKLGKIFGAFSDATSFAYQVLMGPQRALTRCFYEIIREGRPCKAYFDLEVEPGVMSPDQGVVLCQQVIAGWAERIRVKWPQALQQCPRCLEVLILDGSRRTRDGWKVSYHLVYPWLTFQRNNVTLREEVAALSDAPQFQYTASDGARRRFIDSSVYSRNRQFRLGLCYKLSDATQTPLRLPGGPSISTFLLSCITRIEADSWIVPETVSEGCRGNSASRGGQHRAAQASPWRGSMPRQQDVDPLLWTVITSLYALLRQHGLPDGELRILKCSTSEGSFRWGVAGNTKWPCYVARSWRPADPMHDSNGAIVSFDKTRAVFFKCLHPECRRRSRGSGDFVGHVPRSLFFTSASIGVDGGDSLRPHRAKRSVSGASASPAASPTCKKRSLTCANTASAHSEGPSQGGNLQDQAHGTPDEIKAQTQAPATNDESSSLDHPASSEDSGSQTTADSFPTTPARTHEQSLLRIYDRNQSVEDTFEAWHAPSGAWGGRVGTSPLDLPSQQAFEAQATATVLQDWAVRAIDAPFFESPPALALSSINDQLVMNNNSHSQECQGTLQGWAELVQPAPVPTTVPTNCVEDTSPRWAVQPPKAWFDKPLGQREPVGHELLVAACARIESQDDELQTLNDSPDIWSNPFTVAFISVGFRRLRFSLPGVLSLLEKHRPDILFLGDLGTSRNHIGRLRQQVQADVDEEWIFLSNIGNTTGYPVGSGALVHASAARYIRQMEVDCPPELEYEQWSLAVPGRILHLEFDHPDRERRVWFVGLNQHVAAGDRVHARDMVLATLRHITTRAKDQGLRLVILGDANSAPEGGRWGYSRHSKTRAADLRMTAWLSQTPLREVSASPLQATWKACLLLRKATLDRAWIFPDNLPVSNLEVSWAEVHPVFDHAMILLRFPHTVAGIGFAGACRPLRQTAFDRSRCRVNLRKFREPEIVAEWSRLLQLSLREAPDVLSSLTANKPESLDIDAGNAAKEIDSERQAPMDPFEALKYAEMMADRIAQSLAPRRTRRPGEVCKSFCFGGHRAIFREMNCLRAAREFVQKVLIRAPEIVECPHRLLRWQLAVSRLNSKLAKSKYSCPPPLLKFAAWYFGDCAKGTLTAWLDQARKALDVRWTAVREAFAKAQFTNIKQAREKLMRNGGLLDKQLLRAALGKRQPRPRMWGVAGQVDLGASLAVPPMQHQMLLSYLNVLPEASGIVRIEGTGQALVVWFRGPRALGDFLLKWCTTDHPFKEAIVHTLKPSQTYIAIVPDDILAIQELHMASEGMDTESICFICRAPGVQPISTTALKQVRGNPKRAVRFFCSKCRCVCDDVDLAPLSPCPIPWNVWKDMRRIPKDLAPLICRHVDFDTLEAIVNRLRNGKSTGCDGIPREFYKYGPKLLLELLRSAINAYLGGAQPKEYAHEWEGAICGLIAKVPTALWMTDQRPIAGECTKFIIFTTFLNNCLNRAVEDYQLLDEAQEGFRQHRSTRRQLSKLQGLLAQQRENRSQSVVLFLDIKNAFNAINHRAIFAVLEAYGFHPVDVELFRRIYKGRFLSVCNAFGETAACFLRRGVFQGDSPSPTIFNLTNDPIHKMVRASGRGCPALGLDRPSGSSGFADDTSCHTGGPDAIPAMRIIVNIIGPVYIWLGMFFNMKKSVISAIDHSTGLSMPTDSITVNGVPFSVLSPSEPHKHLGVRMTLTGDFAAEKARVRSEMQRRLDELQKDEVLPPPLKELAITIGVTSIFRYSAGVVPWTRSELEVITKTWIRAYKYVWFKAAGRSMDSSPIVLCHYDGGRDCPSACEIYVREGLDTLDQCMTLPGEIAQFILCRLRQQCHAHGCVALTQLQSLLRISGSVDANSHLHQLLLRLDEQGLQVSSPWPAHPCSVIAEVLWPLMWRAWQRKMSSSAIDRQAPLFSSGEAQAEWEQAKDCLHALKKLGSSGILTVSELRGQGGQWLAWREGRLRSCGLTNSEHRTLLAWLDRACEMTAACVAHDSSAEQPMRQRVIPSDVHVGYASGLPLPRVDLPPCICGIARSFAAHEQVVLEYSSSRSRLPVTADLSAISDADFAKELSRQRAVFSVTLDGSRDITVECLAPLRSLAPSFTQPECIIVQDLAAETLSCQFAVFTVAFVRDCLRESCVEALGEACRRPQWKVSKTDLEVWFDLCSPSTTSPVSSQWVRGGSGKDGQSILLTTESRVQCKRPVIIPRAQLLLHPWQIEPPLPDLVRIDLINHHPQFLPSPKGWLVCKRNARVIITGPEHVAVGLDAAQYGMLADTTNQGVVPSESFMQHVVASCHSQERADEEYYVPWSRHLLACLRRILAVDFIVGTRAVASNPHYQHFFSPVETDSSLGASTDWPPQPALLLLDCFAPEDRPNILEQAAKHGHPVWVLRLDQPSRRAIVDIRKLQELRAQRVVDLPAKSLVHHNTQCWSAAQWDSQGSRYISQFWLLRPPSGSDVAYTDPNIVREQLGSWDNRRYDFHYNPDSSTHRLKSYRACQQDAVLYTGQGLFGGCDGSADRKHERMGAGAILTAGSTLDPILQISVPVGGPLASVRPEAVALLCLLQQIREKMDVPGRLTVFIDCLCLLQFLSKWGRANYWPGPKDIIHFDVLLPLLKTLRAWPREVVLLKVKSHSGCHHNEVADELAAVGASLGEPPSFAGPKKYGVLQLRIKPAVRALISSEQARADLPQDIAPNKSILKKVVHVNTRRAVQLRTTIFARCLVRTEEGSTVARMISQQGSSEIRCWMQAMTGTYPVATYLHRIGRAQSRQCPFCSSGQDETLSHFLSVCSRFHDARTAAHNQIRSQLSVSLRESLPAGWQLFEETPMLATGLQLRRIPTAQVQDSGRPVSDADVVAGEMATGRWRPDFLAVSYSRSKIAIVEVCRPSDVRLERLDAAHQGKLAVYAPLLTALGFYIESGWAVQILPWVIGARGLIKKRNLCNALEFLEVPHRKQQSIIEGTVQTSIAALAFMHRTRFAARNTGPNQTSSSSKIDPTVFDLSGKGKRKAQNGPGDLGAIMMCWKRMTAASRRH